MTYTFNLNKTQLLTRALQLINVIDKDTSPTPEELSYASDMLNMYIKFHEGKGMTLWKRRLGYVFPSYHTASYLLGSSGDHCTNTYVATTLSSAASSGASTISVTSYTGMSNGDNIGIELDDGTRQWLTISGAPSSTITLSSTLSGAAASGNTIITYTSKINRPLRILRATTIDLDNNNTEVRLNSAGYDEYFNIPIKSTPGLPNQFYYDRILDGTTPYNGKLYVFPAAASVNKIISFTYHDSLADIINGTDNADFPQEWLLPLLFKTACILAYSEGKYQELQQLQPEADRLMSEISEGQSNSDSAPVRIKFNPRKR